MTKFSVTTLTFLILMSGLAHAEWEKIGTTERGTMYADPDTIRRKGDLVKMWNLFDFNTIQTLDGTSFLSSTGQNEFDCAEERTRVLAFTWFSGNMEKGQVVSSSSNELKWTPIAPRSFNKAMWEIACGKK